MVIATKRPSLPYLISSTEMMIPARPAEIEAASRTHGITPLGTIIRAPGVVTKQLPDGTTQICAAAWSKADLQHIQREYAAGKEVARG